MNNLFRALIAGYGAKKLGGGCLGTVLVFVLIWVALGQCSFKSIHAKSDPVKAEPVVCQYQGNVIYLQSHMPYPMDIAS
jgi:hypothetical protein